MTKKKQKIPVGIVCTAIIGLVLIECVAMYFGFNGTLRVSIVAIIAGLAGWTLPSPTQK